MKINRIPLLILALLALTLAGCVNVTQNIEINPDGSGLFEIDMGISEGLLSMMESSGEANGLNTFSGLGEDFESDNPYVKAVSSNEYNEEGFKHYAITAEITDMAAFLAQLQEGDDSGVQINLQKLDNGNMLFSQILDMSSSAPSGTDTDALTAGVLANAFQGNYWTLTLKIPNVETTNGVYDKETGTVTWKVPIAELISGQYEMRAEFKPATPWTRLTPIILVACVVLLILAGVIASLILRSRRTAAPPTDVVPPIG